MGIAGRAYRDEEIRWEERRPASMPQQDPPAVEMVLVHPERYEDGTAIADRFDERHPALINLEGMPTAAARRLLDFLAGVAYAQDGRLEKVARNAYLLLPAQAVLTAAAPVWEYDGAFFEE
jgi:cell division protein sepF